MPKTIAFKHDTVLLHETVDMLEVKPNGIYVDATLGGAGHSEYLLSKQTYSHSEFIAMSFQTIDIYEMHMKYLQH